MTSVSPDMTILLVIVVLVVVVLLAVRVAVSVGRTALAAWVLLVGLGVSIPSIAAARSWAEARIEQIRQP